MKEIKNLSITQLRQEEDFGFHQLVNKELNKCSDEKFSDVLQIYNTCLENLDLALKPQGASPLTKRINDLDNQRDNAYHGLATHIRNSMRHFNQEKAEAAHKVNTVLQKYGDPTPLPYIQQNGIMVNLIQDLCDGNINECLAQIEGIEWLTELNRLNSEFITFFSDRNLEQSSVVTGVSKEARLQTDEAYRNCVKRINSLSEIFGVSEYATIIDAVNKLIDYEKSVLAARKTRHHSTAEERI